MQLNMLKAKIHRAVVTQTELHYEGSIAVDGNLLDAAGIREYEQVHVFNVDNGERLVTYAIRAEEGSGVISINGAAAHRAQPRQRVIICAFARLEQAELEQFKPRLVHVDGDNRQARVDSAISSPAAA